MEISGIVAEYNPFHNGHFYQIQQTKSKLKSDRIVVVMSGNFSQRGEATITDKFTRTKMALLNGVDLVLELPTFVATASAEFFAQGAMRIFDQSGIITSISFGSESGNLSLLEKIAHTLIYNQDRINPLIKKYLKLGLSYPRARQQGLLEFFTSNHTLENTQFESNVLLDALKNPNNILGIEYLKALMQLGSSIKPFTIKREGSHYHDKSINGIIASATAIRQSLLGGFDYHTHSTPSSVGKLLNTTSLPSMEKLSAFLHYKLMFSKVETLYAIWDIPKDLLHTFLKNVSDAPTYETLVNRSVSKTYTRATVQRSLLRILLEIQESDLIMKHLPIQIPYIRVLGCRKSSTDLLKQLVTHSKVPVITNLNKHYPKLGHMEKVLIDYEIQATKLYAYVSNQPQLAMSDFTQPFIIL